MKKTYFCTSDIHGFFDIFKEALIREGFDINDPSHILVVVGDIFDRGEQALEVYEFLKSLPRERRILIRGNHEILLRELVNRGYAESHDDHNGTYATLFQLAQLGFKNEADMTHEYYRELARKQLSYGDPGYEDVRLKYKNLRRKLYKGKVKEILDWIASDEWVNYYELDEYIFVHAWMPTCQKYEFDKWYIPQKVGPETYREDWRNATPTEWEDAMWGCPWNQYLKGLFKPEEEKGKILVCGHWHSYDFKIHLDHKTFTKDNIDYSAYISDHLIALDACTVVSHQVNIYKIEKEDN